LVLVTAMGMPAALRAGDLNPPVGPIMPTMKTLTEVEPRTPISLATTPGDGDSLYKITQPGSYYLTGNVQGVAGKMGIEVVTSHVTIDMRGFDLVGMPGSLAGIDTNNGAAGGIIGTVVRDGTIRGWGSDGIKGNQSQGHFINLVISNITGEGITINTSTTIESCLIYSCSANGISTSNNVVVHNTICAGNGLHGISVGTSSTVTNSAGYINGGTGIVIWGGKGTISFCNATLNNAYGLHGFDGSTISNCHVDNNFQGGIAVGDGGVISNCASVDNTGPGINTGQTATVESCSVSGNTGHGILVSNGSVIGCTARENGDDGIHLNSGGLVEGCTVEDNTDDGIATGTGCNITQCKASTNGGDGIDATTTASISECVTYANTLNGIEFSSDSRIVGNTCDSNGNGAGDGAGLHTTGSDSRVEGNNVTDNDRGIDVDAAGNLIVRNSASGNLTNYAIIANNKVGTIVLAPDSLAIIGDTGGAGVGSTSPWANFSY
jgi:parallel beta-helix repeat protein